MTAVACRAYPPIPWAPSHGINVLAAAVADAVLGIPRPEAVCRDDADRAAYAAHYETAVKAEAARAEQLEVGPWQR